MRFTVVSWPATNSRMHVMSSSPSLSLSPCSSAAIRRLSRSSRGVWRRSGMRSLKYGAQLAIEQEIEADAAGPGERQSGGLRAGKDRQVLAPHHRTQVRLGGAAAGTAPNVQVRRADAFGLGDIHVVEVRHSPGFARVDERHPTRGSRSRRPPSPPTF
jgi:hypothetical protein